MPVATMTPICTDGTSGSTSSAPKVAASTTPALVVAQLLANRGAAEPLGELTAREREVLGVMAEGRSNVAIAGRLFVTEMAVSKHINNIFSKLRLPPSTDDHRRVLAVLAYLNGAAGGRART